ALQIAGAEVLHRDAGNLADAVDKIICVGRAVEAHGKRCDRRAWYHELHAVVFNAGAATGAAYEAAVRVETERDLAARQDRWRGDRRSTQIKEASAAATH